MINGGFPEAVQRLPHLTQSQLAFVTPTLPDRALRLYSDRPDKTWGLADCASFVVMNEGDLEPAQAILRSS